MLTPQVKDSNHFACGISGKITSINGGIKAIANQAFGFFQVSLGFAVLAAHYNAHSSTLLISALKEGLLSFQLAPDVFLSIRTHSSEAWKIVAVLDLKGNSHTAN